MKTSKTKEKKLGLEIRSALPFLFETHNGKIVPNSGILNPEPFDYATITVACHRILIRVVCGRGEISLTVAQSKNANSWHDLLLVMAAIDRLSQLPERRFFRDLQEAAALLKQNIARLDDAFGCDDDGETARRLEHFHKVDRASMREWEFEINTQIK